MNPAGRLVLSVEQIAGESLPGYVARLALRARFPRADRLAAMAGLRQPGLAFQGADLSGLARLAAVELSGLEAAAYGPTGRMAHHRFLGGTLHREFIDVSRRRACPECLKESPHHRAAWDFALAASCPRHAVRLVSSCPACRRKLGWREPDLTRCRCRRPLAAAPAEGVGAGEAASQAAVLALACGGPLPPMPAAIAACGRADLVRVVMCLGMFMTGWRKARRVETLAAAGPDAVAEVVGAGLGCLREWPGRLHAFLAAERGRAGLRPGRYGARKALGPFYDWLNLMEAGPIKATLAEAAAAFVRSDGVLARQSHRSALVASPGGPPLPFGMLEAGARLGTRAAGVRRLIEAGLLAGEASGGRGVPAALDAGGVERLAVLTDGALDLAGTSRALGISKDRVRRLVDGGLLAPLHGGNAAGWGRWLFDRGGVASLLERLEGLPDPGDGGRTVSFETAVEVLRRRGLGIAAVVGAAMDGWLPVTGLDTAMSGLKRLRFLERDVRAVCAGREEDGAPLSVREAARRLGLKWQVVAHLAGAGLLEAGAEGIPAASVASFGARFVSGAALARRRGTSPGYMARMLALRGVRPVVGPDVDGSRQNFYRVGEVD